MVPIRNQTSDFVILCSDTPPLSNRKLCSEANHYQVSLVGRDRVKVREQMIRISNGNWTEWTAIWFEIILVISKWNECTAQVWFEIISMISDQNCTTGSSITTLLHQFWNRRLQLLRYRIFVVCTNVLLIQ